MSQLNLISRSLDDPRKSPTTVTHSRGRTLARLPRPECASNPSPPRLLHVRVDHEKFVNWSLALQPLQKQMYLGSKEGHRSQPLHCVILYSHSCIRFEPPRISSDTRYTPSIKRTSIVPSYSHGTNRPITTLATSAENVTVPTFERVPGAFFHGRDLRRQQCACHTNRVNRTSLSTKPSLSTSSKGQQTPRIHAF